MHCHNGKAIKRTGKLRLIVSRFCRAIDHQMITKPYTQIRTENFHGEPTNVMTFAHLCWVRNQRQLDRSCRFHRRLRFLLPFFRFDWVLEMKISTCSVQTITHVSYLRRIKCFWASIASSTIITVDKRQIQLTHTNAPTHRLTEGKFTSTVKLEYCHLIAKNAHN